MGRAGLQTVTNSKVSVAATSTEVLAANTSREYVAITNDSDETVYLGLGEAAVMNEGIRINANGGSFEMNFPMVSYGAINAICSSGTKNVCVVEGV